MSAELQHGKNCGYWTEQDAAECTCGLHWRKALITEQTMHAAWRKRAEEGESALAQLREAVRVLGEECRDMREREPIGPSTNPGIIACRKATDANPIARAAVEAANPTAQM